MGIDSAVPLRLGLEGIELKHDLQSHTPRGNFWDTAKYVTPLALKNLETVREWIK